MNKFITASTHFFVEMDSISTLYGVVGNDVTIPCRTTSPEIIPILYRVSHYVINFAILFVIVNYNFNMLHAFKYYVKLCKCY